MGVVRKQSSDIFCDVQLTDFQKCRNGNHSSLTDADIEELEEYSKAV